MLIYQLPSLASASQAENISTGTSILTLSTSNAEGTLSYSLTDDDNKFAINGSTGEVTLANALDYETEISIHLRDSYRWRNNYTETFTLNVTDVDLALSDQLQALNWKIFYRYNYFDILYFRK